MVNSDSDVMQQSDSAGCSGFLWYYACGCNSAAWRKKKARRSTMMESDNDAERFLIDQGRQETGNNLQHELSSVSSRSYSWNFGNSSQSSMVDSQDPRRIESESNWETNEVSDSDCDASYAEDGRNGRQTRRRRQSRSMTSESESDRQGTDFHRNGSGVSSSGSTVNREEGNPLQRTASSCTSSTASSTTFTFANHGAIVEAAHMLDQLEAKVVRFYPGVKVIGRQESSHAVITETKQDSRTGADDVVAPPTDTDTTGQENAHSDQERESLRAGGVFCSSAQPSRDPLITVSPFTRTASTIGQHRRRKSRTEIPESPSMSAIPEAPSEHESSDINEDTSVSSPGEENRKQTSPSGKSHSPEIGGGNFNVFSLVSAITKAMNPLASGASSVTVDGAKKGKKIEAENRKGKKEDKAESELEKMERMEVTSSNVNHEKIPSKMVAFLSADKSKTSSDSLSKDSHSKHASAPLINCANADAHSDTQKDAHAAVVASTTVPAIVSSADSLPSACATSENFKPIHAAEGPRRRRPANLTIDTGVSYGDDAAAFAQEIRKSIRLANTPPKNAKKEANIPYRRPSIESRDSVRLLEASKLVSAAVSKLAAATVEGVVSGNDTQRQCDGEMHAHAKKVSTTGCSEVGGNSARVGPRASPHIFSECAPLVPVVQDVNSSVLEDYIAPTAQMNRDSLRISPLSSDTERGEDRDGDADPQRDSDSVRFSFTDLSDHDRERRSRRSSRRNSLHISDPSDGENDNDDADADADVEAEEVEVKVEEEESRRFLHPFSCGLIMPTRRASEPYYHGRSKALVEGFVATRLEQPQALLRTRSGTRQGHVAAIIGLFDKSNNVSKDHQQTSEQEAMGAREQQQGVRRRSNVAATYLAAVAATEKKADEVKVEVSATAAKTVVFDGSLRRCPEKVEFSAAADRIGALGLAAAWAASFA